MPLYYVSVLLGINLVTRAWTISKLSMSSWRVGDQNCTANSMRSYQEVVGHSDYFLINKFELLSNVVKYCLCFFPQLKISGYCFSVYPSSFPSKFFIIIIFMWLPNTGVNHTYGWHGQCSSLWISAGWNAFVTSDIPLTCGSHLGLWI